MLFSCGRNEMKKVEALTDREEIPVRTSYGVEMTYTDSGRKQMKLFADRMDHFKGDGDEGGRIEFQGGFHMLFYNSKDSIKSELEAEEGTLYENQNRMVARNDVIVRNAQGERLNTEKLTWDQDSGKVFTDKFVKITREKGVIHGNGLVAKEDLSSYKIQEITGEWYFDKPGQKADAEKTQ